MTFMKLFKNKLEESKGFGKKIINLSYKNIQYSKVDPFIEKSIMNISQQLMDMVPTVWEEIHYMGVVRKKDNEYEYYSAYYFKEEMINHWFGSYTIVDKYHIEERRFLNLLSKLNDELKKYMNFT